MDKVILALLVILITTFSILSEHFFTLSNFLNILSSISIIGLLSLGLTFVIATGGIDLSVGSILALASVLTATFINEISANIYLAILIALTSGALAGLLNGFLINLTKAPSFIVTLGTLSVYRSLCFILTDATPIYGLPDNLIDFYQGDFFKIPRSIYIFAISILVAYLLLTRSRTGRHLQLFGDSSMSARAQGISPEIINLITFSLSGLCAGIAGFLFIVKTNSGDPASGVNYELLAITAVILGGANLFGGPVSIIGTLLGVILIGILQNGLNLYGVSTYYQILFVGLVLIVSGSKGIKSRGTLR